MLIRLKVHPSAKKPAITRKTDSAYEVWVRAPAQQGLANREALDALAQAIGREPKKLIIVKGASTSAKIVKVYD